MFGELVPVGGGDPIPLLKKRLLVGRRESCDIVLRFPNVSAHHCELSIFNGYWFVKDLQSRNGVKVNGKRVEEKRLDPGATVAIAKHVYTIHYSPDALGAVGPPPSDASEIENILSRSLLERAGLSKPRHAEANRSDKRSAAGRYDVLNNDAGQIKDSNKPI